MLTNIVEKIQAFKEKSSTGPGVAEQDAKVSARIQSRIEFNIIIGETC